MNRRQVYRYLHLDPDKELPELENMIDECEEEVLGSVVPKSIFGLFKCDIIGNIVSIGGLDFISERLARHLAGCKEAVVFALTLGVNSDMLLRKYSAGNMGKAAVMQAVLADITDEKCDELEEFIVSKLRATAVRRFSPGYFDLSLESQKNIFDLIDVSKRIGVSLTDSCMMIPTKSVTAIIGIKERATDEYQEQNRQ